MSFRTLRGAVPPIYHAPSSVNAVQHTRQGNFGGRIDFSGGTAMISLDNYVARGYIVIRITTDAALERLDASAFTAMVIHSYGRKGYVRQTCCFPTTSSPAPRPRPHRPLRLGRRADSPLLC